MLGKIIGAWFMNKYIDLMIADVRSKQLTIAQCQIISLNPTVSYS